MQNGLCLVAGAWVLNLRSGNFLWRTRMDFVDASIARGRANSRAFKWPICVASRAFSWLLLYLFFFHLFRIFKKQHILRGSKWFERKKIHEHHYCRLIWNCFGIHYEANDALTFARDGLVLMALPFMEKRVACYILSANKGKRAVKRLVSFSRLS